MQSPSPSRALATELSVICAQFGEVLSRTSQIAEIAGSSFYSQVQEELSQQSIQSLLRDPAASSLTSPKTVKHELVSGEIGDLSTASNELKRLWRRSLEDWIAQQLEAARGDGAAIPTTFAEAASSEHRSAQDANASSTNLLLAESSQSLSLLPPQQVGDPSSAVFPGTAVSPFGSYPPPAPHRAMSASPVPGTIPLAPFVPVGPYVLQPSPFLSPFPFPTYFGPAMMPSSPHGLVSPLPTSPGSTTPLAGPHFGGLEVEDSFPWNPSMLGFEANGPTMAMVQPPTPTPYNSDTPDRLEDSPASRRLSSASLPRLITTDLSPTNGFTSSPTINISRSPTPDPLHSRTRSLSTSETANPGGKASHHRRLSSGSVRYHPFPTPPRGDSSPHLQPAVDHALAGAMTPSPSSLLSELTLTTSNSPQSSNESLSGQSRGAPRRRRSRSTDHRARTARALQYDEGAVFVTNSVDVFVVHTQSRTKCEVTEQDVLEIELDPEPGANSPTSILFQVVHSRRPYTRELLEQDCELRSSYQFVSSRAGAVTKWTVAFDFEDDTTDGLEVPRRPRASIEPVIPLPHTLANRVFTYVHFPIDTIVVNPTHPIGSSAWWRVQACEGRHDHCPGTGAWTARWDEEGSERRPSRIVQHYATCSLRKAEGDFFSLGKLARAVKRVGLPKDA